jgi:hypothetical protein
MADTRVQLEIAQWICVDFLPKEFPGHHFSSAKVQLTSGGIHEFNAVSYNREIIVNITTSDARTASGKLAVGKLTKVRADMFFLMMTNAHSKVLAFTQKSMYELCQRERELGRVPEAIKLMLVSLPEDLEERLAATKRKASNEVRPQS